MIPTSLNPFSRNSKGRLVTHSSPESRISEQFKTIRANIQILLGDERKNILLFTATKKSDGNTTLIANLAVSIAQQRERVLLIDGNLRRPGVHSFFKVSNNVGLTDVLTEKSQLEEAITPTDIAGLDLLTSGSVKENPAELIGLKSMRNLLRIMKNRYDYVLVDSPSILEAAETRILANRCEGVVLVVNRQKTALESTIEAKKILDFANVKLLGVVMNK
ncbi:CpsD/CapB family tyrosine-protein kinase [Cytobacillus suaedae]|nr:CpsD/CapB family tyrosine-protein kinase [Cytobacillus suaedae]